MSTDTSMEPPPQKKLRENAENSPGGSGSVDTKTSDKTSSNKEDEEHIIIEWEQYYMGVAKLCAKRSKDPSRQVGACIVNKEKKIVGTGYNGMPAGCKDGAHTWNKDGKTEQGNDTKYPYVCHAEMNAVLFRNTIDVKDCTIYTTLFPCNECAKVIIQSGITEVVYASDAHSEKESTKAAKKLFKEQSPEIPTREYEEREKKTIKLKL